MAGGVKAENDFCAWRPFDAQALCSDWNTSIAADFDQGANAPNIWPPRTSGRWTQDGSVFFFGKVPGRLWNHPKLAMSFVLVAMEAQGVDVNVGNVDVGDFFTGEVGGQAALPILMRALDFSFGLWRWSIKETDVVKLEVPAQLSKRVGIFGKKDGVIIDVDLQRASVSQEGGRKEIQIGEQEFPAINFRGDKESAAIIEHIDHGEIQRTGRKPAMGCGVQLPKFADLGALPATHWGSWAFEGGRMLTLIFHSPETNLGAIQLEGMQSQGFGGDKTIGAGRIAKQAFLEKVNNRLGPSLRVIATGDSRNPNPGFFSGAGKQVIGGE